jgi:hypothetical protein
MATQTDRFRMLENRILLPLLWLWLRRHWVLYEGVLAYIYQCIFQTHGIEVRLPGPPMLKLLVV